MSTNTDKKSSKINMKAEPLTDKNSGIDSLQKMSADEMKYMLHELYSQQIELEVQNDELRRAQQELSEVRNQYVDLYEYAPVGYIVLDFNNTINDANLTICRMLGVNRLSLYRSGIFDFLSTECSESFCSLMSKIRDSGSSQMEDVKMQKKDGSEFYARLECTPQDNSEGHISKIRIAVIDITDRRKAEEKILERKKRFKDIAFSMADWIWEVDNQGRYTYCSEKVDEVLGYSVKDVIGKTPFDFMASEEAAEVGKIFKELSEQKKPIVDLENWNITKSGKKVCLLTNGVPIIDSVGNLTGYRGVDKNITVRKRAEKALQTERIFNETIIQSIPGLFYVFDKEDAHFIRRNSNWVTVTGYSEEELDSMTALDVVKDKKLCAEKMQEVYDKGMSSMENIILTKPGKQIPYYFTGNRLVIDDKIYLAGVGLDITAQKNKSSDF